MSASSLVINLGEDSFNMEDHSESFLNESEGKTNDSSPLHKSSPPETLQDDDIDLPQCKIKRNYACSHCSYYTQNPRFYLYHLKNVHKEKIRIYECPSCLYASKHSQKLQRHVHMVHVMCAGKRKVPSKPKPPPKPPKLPKPPPPSKIIRTLPKEEEEEEDSFVSGMFTGDGENRNYKCSLCPFTSRSQTLVTRHERIVHLKKKFFRCIKCNYMTHMKARYTKHVKYHSMPMIKCEMCDFRTPYKWNLDRHNKNHMGDGAFKCSLCNFTADIKQSLTVHEMNHHVPPVGQATPTKRRNRVGASDTVSALEDESIDHDELELLRLEREDELSDGDIQAQISDTGIESLNHLDELEVTTKPLPPSSRPKKIMMKKPKAVAHFNTKELTVKLGEKVVNPGDVLQHKNGAVYVKKIKCRVCNYRAAWDSEMSRHELRVHGLSEKKKIPARPIPNLIPLQNKSPSQPPPPSLLIPPPPLKGPQQKPQPPQMHSSHQMQQVPHMQSHHPPNLKLHSRPPSHPQLLLQPSQSILLQPSSHQLILQPQPHPHPLILPSHPHQAQQMLQGQHHYHQTPPLRPPPAQPPSPHSQPPILKIPTLAKGKTPTSANTPERAMSEKDLNDICAKSCPNSSLKDFASLIGGDDAFKTSEENVAFSVGSGTSAFPIEKKENKAESVEPSGEIKKTPEAFKKKNASFFDKLKEKLMTGASESCNLVCDVCGHESKCLSESVRHQKMHNTKISGSSSCNGGTVISGAELSSTRCQHCRQRCKTSSDLVIHLQSCMEANKKSPIHIIDDDEEDEEEDEDRMDFEDDLKSEDGLSDGELEKPPHPMENKVFVWTNMSNCEEDALHDEDDSGSKSPTSESSVVGIETAPGIGAVTSKSKSSLHATNGQNGNLQKSKAESVKKVYKCPHCSFWASTASRFHVHIVGHLNKKPFECSLCSYRSNWRWDITKHIRLKTVRDSTHERARVLMTDETGRRNYSKYNKYLTLMRVHEPSAESSGTGRRSKPLTQSYDPIETLPAPPKLTPAPLSALQSASSNNVQIMINNSTPPPLPPLSQRPLYSKPPPLQSSLDMKRSGQESDLEPPKKKQNVENKKTMWKCKKCLFRDSDRAVVLAHVKEHYRSQTQSVIGQDSRGSSLNELTDEAQEASALGDDAPFMCGHCHQVSNWKHVIQRHCRLKHSGDVKIIVGQPRQGGPDENSFQDNNEFMDDGENEHANGFMCETCPFVCSNQKDLDEHMECHFERPGATLKCYYCPFYVRDKMQLIDHISLHGDSDGDDGSRNLGSQQGRGSLENGESNTNKRYRCSICPYVSNSKSQFLYHKQFHRPRNAPFKCTMCSYNVTRRHLLHQHLRLHGINILIPKTKDFGFNEFEEGVDLVGTMNELDTTKMAEIPLVWVSKMGNLTKMFKCRFCPHVNIRKSNIQEHEKMHGIRIKNNNPDGSPPHPQQQHHCPDCNYICNNAGVLSSHAKVHQGLFGQVCSLVDLNRPDDVQIKELNTILGRHEEGPPEILPDEINKDFKDSSPAPQVSHNDRDGEHPNMDGKVLHFCSTCPARFLYPKELEIHTRFHNLQLQFRCQHCTYTARQQPHLLAHYKVHTDEYQDRTSSLCEVYRISNQNPKPKIAVVVDGSESAGNAWVVVPMQRMVHTNNHTTEYELDETLNDISLHGSRVIHKQFSCSKCPAKFFKTVALQYHMTLHGGPGPHKCRVCDYSVKTYGNLIKHEAVHEELEPRAKVKSKPKRASENIPTSGTELFRQKTEAAQKCAANPPLPPPPPPPLHIDPEFGILMHGSPEFIYPTYLKNGRLKEKRYKCHKCPSAFEKREQYKVHLSLHGSKQRYKCERCDYSVKYYANYIQHLRKHQSNDATKAERTISSDGKGIDELGNESTTEINDSTIPQSNEDLTNIVISRSAKKMQLSMADQQTMMLMQQRVVSNSISAPEILNRCPHCPYSNQRKDGVGSHARCHSNVKGGAFTCKHCDYTVPQQHFLREHNKLHFTPLKGMRPEAYMKCDRLELWAEPIEQTNEPVNKLLIFKDKGANFKVKRFLPDVPEEVVVNGDSDTAERTFINLKSGELEIGQGSPESPEKDDNKENKETMYNGSVKEEGSADETLQEKNQDEDKVQKTEENNSDSEIDNNNKIENSANNESSQESEDKIVNEEESVNGEDKSVNSEGDDKSLNEDKSVSGDEKSVNCEDKGISEEEKQTQSKSDSEQHVNSSSSDSDSEDSSSDSSSSSDESDGESSSSSATSNHQD